MYPGPYDRDSEGTKATGIRRQARDVPVMPGLNDFG
jgi:hypothetical protein